MITEGYLVWRDPGTRKHYTVTRDKYFSTLDKRVGNFDPTGTLNETGFLTPPLMRPPICHVESENSNLGTLTLLRVRVYIKSYSLALPPFFPLS